MFSLIKKLFRSNSKSKWNVIKESEDLYVKGPIAILRLKSKKNSLLTGWVNKGYKDYPYKKFCNQNFLIKVNLLDNLAASNLNIGMDEIEAYFTSNLRKSCVCHLVARLATDEGLNLEVYLDDRTSGMLTLLNLSKDQNKLASFTYESHYDPDWDAVQGLFNL